MENKHNSYDLAQMQSLPLYSKIIMTQQRIKGWYEEYDGNVYVAVSGGKDSQVLAHIVKEMYPDVPCVCVNTGLEYDSVRLNGAEISDVILRPAMPFVEVITKYGYPIISKMISHNVSIAKNCPDGKLIKRYFLSDDMAGSTFDCRRYKWLIDAPFKVSDQCCTIMKKKPSHKYEKETNRKVILGTMADESLLRRKEWLRNGCNAFDISHPRSAPLSFWRESDILEYAKLYNIKFADVYGDITEDLKLTGVNRTGCVFCMFGIQFDKDRFLKLKEIEPIKYDYIMRGGAFNEHGVWIPAPDEDGKMGLGYKFVIDWLNEHGNLDIKY